MSARPTGRRSVESVLGMESSPVDLPLGARMVARLVGGLRQGELRVVWPDGREACFMGKAPGGHATLVVREPRALARVLLSGSVGFAEGYLQGFWDTPDLVTLLTLLAADIVARSGARRPRVPLRPVHRLRHGLRANTKTGSKANVTRHYDLGNDFYRLWLDPTMSYSCALFDDGCSDTTDAALEAAQTAKWDRLLDLVRPRTGDRLLEVGSGWGGFALHAARTRGCRVVGITLSREQLAYSRRWANEEGLDDRVEFRLEDYRDVTETFDAVASIEMIEAVGERYWPGFFRWVRERLRPGGRAGLQAITIAEERFAAYRRRPDFTQRYIFPGGMLPSMSALRAAAAEGGLVMDEPAFFALDYAATLSAWLERFDARAAEVRALGFDERFRRMWRYYLAYCIAGFRNGMIDVVQVALR